MKVYEGMFLLKAGEAAVDSQIDVVKGIIEKRKGIVREISKWDDRKLAYEIGKDKRGLYILSYFEAPPEAVSQIRRDCRLSEEVIRVLIVNTEKYKEAEAAPSEPQEEKSSGKGTVADELPQEPVSEAGISHETDKAE